MAPSDADRLIAIDPDLERLLVGDAQGAELGETVVREETLWVVMRDGTRLATDVYLPLATPAPVVTTRTPYGRKQLRSVFMRFARRGYVVVAQDCRGTGDSEPDHWDFTVFERDDSYDHIEWITQQQWCDGFIASCGGSYGGWTQWCMALHPSMSAIAPERAGLGVIPVTRPRLHMFVNAYSRSVGRDSERPSLGPEKTEIGLLSETLSSGYFNEPLAPHLPAELGSYYPELNGLPPAERQSCLLQHYSALSTRERAPFLERAFGHGGVKFATMMELPALFGHSVPQCRYQVFYAPSPAELAKSLKAPVLMVTGWYDWSLEDTLATWEVIQRHADKEVRGGSCLLITPAAHNQPGYHEGVAEHRELDRAYRTLDLSALLVDWYDARRKHAQETWPSVIYYKTGANEWWSSSAWPPHGSRDLRLYLAPEGQLTPESGFRSSGEDCYVYDPDDPTPTIGGSVLSYVYPPGSVDVSRVQRRQDVLTYTTSDLKADLDVIGPIRVILYVSSTAVDTDFGARLSDLWPDGRAIQLQTGIIRGRYRDPNGPAALLKPGFVYRIEIALSATAHRFQTGHRLRLDISSADFPKFDRNSNLGGSPGASVRAHQTIYRDAERGSRLELSVMSEIHLGG